MKHTNLTNFEKKIKNSLLAIRRTKSPLLISIRLKLVFVEELMTLHNHKYTVLKNCKKLNKT